MLRKEINQVNGMGVLQIRVVRKAPGEVICEQRPSGPLNPRAQHIACVQWKHVVLGSEKGMRVLMHLYGTSLVNLSLLPLLSI